MKYLTIIVPCYNSEAYMERCIDSLLAGGKDVEIIIIDDGSTDRTAEIADWYREEYPEIVKVVHKENGGHGSGVNKGLELARGRYFKVVDSDDWVDQEACQKLIQKIKFFCDKEEGPWRMPAPDLIVCNYIYDHKIEGTSRKVDYKNVFPLERVCTWDEIGRFRMDQYLIMHALVFSTKVLKEAGIRLPENTFYVDNLFANQPLPYVSRIYYADLDFYHYFLGRDDQSVNARNMMKRIDQQIKVTKLVIQSANLKELKKSNPKLEKYLCRNMSVMLAISSIHLLLIQTAAARQKREKLWEEIKGYDYGLYCRLRYRSLSGLIYLPGKTGDYLSLSGYRFAKKIFQFQ